MLERYLKAKEESNRRRKEEYKDALWELYDLVEKALDRKEDYILYEGVLRGCKAEFASLFGFKLEVYSWGIYVHFTKRALKKLEKAIKKIRGE